MTGFILWKTKAILTTSALTFSVWIKKNLFLCTTEEEKKSEKVQNNMRVYKKLKQNYFKVNSRFKLSVGLSVSSHDMNSLVCAAAEFQQV